MMLYMTLFVICFGLIHLLDVVREPETGESVQTAESILELPEESSQEPEREESKEAETESEGSVEEGKKQKPAPEESMVAEIPQEEIPETKPTVIIASDLHYMSPDLTDYGVAFEKFTAKDDGKVLTYSSELIDAFLDEVIEQNPTALILSGDLTLNGEKINHQGLAQKLQKVKSAGIQVLVIPGNHDINNTAASSFFGEKREPAELITAQEFYEIYRDFGYDAAVSRDENSLSYLYKLDEKNWLMMLDSCQYDPVNLVGGRIRQETFPWMEQQLVAARDAGALIIPVAHHNLLYQSKLYTYDCTLEQNKTFIGMLEWWRLPLFFSGHLHLQRIKKYKFEPGVPDDAYSINEIVSGSLAIAPNLYGVLKWTEQGSIEYQTKSADISSWAEKSGSTDENLLNFKQYSDSFLNGTVEDQISSKMSSLPKEQIDAMSQLYGELNRAYCAGTAIDKKQVERDPAYALWERNLPDSSMFKEMQAILKDTEKEHRSYAESLVQETLAAEEGEEIAVD